MNIDEMRRLAEAARDPQDVWFHQQDFNGFNPADADYLVAVDPQTILRLFDVVEAARASLSAGDWHGAMRHRRELSAALDAIEVASE